MQADRRCSGVVARGEVEVGGGRGAVRDGGGSGWRVGCQEEGVCLPALLPRLRAGRPTEALSSARKMGGQYTS